MSIIHALTLDRQAIHHTLKSHAKIANIRVHLVICLQFRRFNRSRCVCVIIVHVLPQNPVFYMYNAMARTNEYGWG